MRIDADREEMRVYEEREERQNAWAKHCPICNVCEERITGYKCYVMNRDYPMESCICESCFKGQLEMLQNTNLAFVFREEIEERFTYDSDYWRETPHGEEE